MMDESDKLARAVRALAIAVWVLCLLTAAQLAFTLWAYWRPQTFVSQGYESAATAGSRAPSVESGTKDNDFFALSPEEKIKRASVILITKYEDEGAKLKAVIKEILKKQPDTRFYFSVGDEYHLASQFREGNEKYGDGQIVFLTGNPATMRESYSYSKDRVGALGQMPLTTLRQLVAQAK